MGPAHKAARSCHGTRTQHQSTAGTAALFEVLRKLTCLQDLHLENNKLVGIAPQQCAALTASSQLTQLVVRQPGRACLPQGAVQHMFPPGRQMQPLQRLAIGNIDFEYNGPEDWCIDSAGLLSITSCCPQLQHLDIVGSVQPRADLSPLLQLPQSCTSLHVGGEAFSDVCVPLLLQLQQLRELSWVDSQGLTDLGFEQLTALDLQRLFVEDDCGLSEQVCPHDNSLKLEASPEKGSVSEQLDALCDCSPVCLPSRHKRSKKLLKAAAEREAGLSSQLQAGAAREEDLRRQLQQRDAQIQHLLQQLSKRGGGSHASAATTARPPPAAPPSSIRNE